MGQKFNLDYFRAGPYKNAKTAGFIRYFGKYYWARKFYATIIDRMTPKGGEILEIGCGFGDLLVFLEDKYKTTGVDISKEAIDQARKRLVKTKLQILQAEKIDSLGKNQFDTAIACHILEHLKNPEKVINKINYVLKTGGWAFFVIPNPESLGKKLKGDRWIGYQDKSHVSLYKPSKWIDLLNKNGFPRVKTFGDGLWDSPYLPVIPTLLQRLIFGFPAIIQTFFTIPFIPVNLGESIILFAKKDNYRGEF